MFSPHELVGTATRLAEGSDHDPLTQGDLRRAVSSAYYALFHILCRHAADLLAGHQDDALTRASSLNVYRSLDHSVAKRACSSGLVLRTLPAPLRNFAETFVDMQARRQRADYDPSFVLLPMDVLTSIEHCRSAIALFESASDSERRAFCTFLLLKLRTAG